MHTIHPDDLRQKIKNKEKIMLLDVRNTDEVEQGFIEGAINIPLHILPLKFEEALPDTQAEIICYCESGGRSSRATQFLEEHGYTHVSNLYGGYMIYSLG
ncbi:MAG: rhodanese-like domain-containing protein [Candidatus Magasanikbacteria bacterium]|nr:rhodanese-like domain-containing protein [Candidatus Magasanikbacteria bacterium]